MSDLFGKRVILVFATGPCWQACPCLDLLRSLYHSKDGTNFEFEIIYMSLDESMDDFLTSIKEMPWLMYPFFPEFSLRLAGKIFGFTPPRLPAIAAFGVDGKLVTKQSNLLSHGFQSNDFPFIQADMDDEICKELMFRYKWDLSEEFPEFNLPV